ncbi:class I SAM-dependent methyltransferase [Qipengyuania sp. XHP0207]|uniref:class I SAM-dependent methyltransferase n=1 Tax=Qipengyuania sp. XHP0207 TaxID=3038078 RepID=UPI00241CF81D|nr:class I SAM-dependent methyltransferase [Qipengyuania sp. XHP0207]MDG5747276.1 class I SAM-dependent methyltransferase [Qipengyuania sp. XHP0207]
MKCVVDNGALAPFSKYNFKSNIFKNVYKDKFVYKCEKCGLRQADVSKVNEDALLRYYAYDYRNVAKIAVELNEGSSPWYQSRAKAIAELVPGMPQRVFELGAGYGYNLKAIKARFPDAEFFTDELDETMRFGGVAQPGSLDDGPFDLIVLSHVLEHFTDPVSLLRSAGQALTSGGVIIVEVPNDLEGIVPLNGPDEPHLTFMTEPTLRNLIQVAGLRIVESFTAGPAVRRPSFGSKVRKAVGRLLAMTAAGRKLIVRRRTAYTTAANFSQRNPDGVFLRAIITANK